MNGDGFPPSNSTICRRLNELRAVCENPRSCEVTKRVAWEVEQAIRWATEDTVGWPKPVDSVLYTARLINAQGGGIADQGEEL